MAEVTVWIDIDAPLDRVWEATSDLAGHGEWMGDVESITFETSQRQGEGTRMRVGTRFGPLRTMDLMTVTAWEPKRRIGVAHEGLITGEGEFLLDPVGSGTRLTWTERLQFPWFFGGPLGALLARPIFAFIWRRNLNALKDRLAHET